MIHKHLLRQIKRADDSDGTAIRKHQEAPTITDQKTNKIHPTRPILEYTQKLVVHTLFFAL